MIVRMKMGKAEEAETGRRGPADRRSMEDQMWIAAMTVTQIGTGTGRAGRTGRGGGATAGATTLWMRRMCLEVKKGGIGVTASGAITGGTHLTVTVVAVILQMTRSDPAGRGGTAGQKAVGRMRMRDMITGEQSDLGRRTGTARGAKEEH